MTSYMKRDGVDEASLKNLYPRAEVSKISHEGHRVLEYLAHEMVFLPINIEKTHWYLAVVNAPKRRIQVLDSLCTLLGRSDLHVVLKGLEKEVKFIHKLVTVEKKMYGQTLM